MNSKITRRSARLLNAVLQLHKQGYQDLAILSGKSPSGLHWRCELHPYSNLVIEDNVIRPIDNADREEAIHSSDQSGNHYFGWRDCQSASARELAELILERFPTLIAMCQRENHEYSGWLVSAAGHAEAGHLPILFADDGSENEAGFVGSYSHNPPPLQRIELIGGQPSIFIRPPHLKPEDDWHTAYIEIISSWRSSDIRRLPMYPRSNDWSEMGAYWEGAIWYIQEILGFSRIEPFLDELRSPLPSSERWATFLAIWNSEGQLEFLVAFLIRYLISGQADQEFNRSRIEEHKKVLQNFEATQSNFERSLPNPYFGGSNPLHLGLILDGTPPDKRLI